MGSCIAELPPSTSQLTLLIMKVLVFLAIASCVVVLAKADTEFSDEEAPCTFPPCPGRWPPRGKRSLEEKLQADAVAEFSDEEAPCTFPPCPGRWPPRGKRSLGEKLQADAVANGRSGDV